MAKDIEKRSAKATRQKKKDVRNHVVKVRMNDEELELLDALAESCHYDRSTLLRTLVTDYEYMRSTARPIIEISSDELRKLRVDMNRVGTNVNQIARCINGVIKSGRPMHEMWYLEDTAKALENSSQELAKISAKVDDVNSELWEKSIDAIYEQVEGDAKWNQYLREAEEVYGDEYN